MKLTAYGKREWMGSGIIAILLIALCIVAGCFWESSAAIYLGILILALWAAVAAFFRDPERKIPQDPAVIVSPADGVVRDIELISECEEELKVLFNGRDILRIGIFLSVFDVHLNRAPCDISLRFKKYKPGAWHDARDSRASKENESMLVGGDGKAGGLDMPVAVKQISGAIARRIVCPVEPGASLSKGQRYGMIKFGSRTELFLPATNELEIAVRVGDRVFGGLSILAKGPPHSRHPETNDPQNQGESRSSKQ